MTNDRFKAWLFATASCVAVATYSQAAFAAAEAAQAASTATEEIVVTGTRIVRDGYEAPTPTTVIGIEAIQSSAPANIADYLHEMPIVVGGNTSSNTNSGASAGTGGLNTIGLRNLGQQRTLVLLDGARSVQSHLNGGIDINTFPQELVSRVDVVTGGASASYGSDAMSGVVNFVLDKTYTGVKGEVSGGLSNYGDGGNWKVTLTAGTPFAGGRGHFLINGLLTSKDMIDGIQRDWNNRGFALLQNPAYGTTAGKTTSVPQNLFLYGVQLSNATAGGIITSGPLKGTAFNGDGTPYQFKYGALTSDPYTQTGDVRGVFPLHGSQTLQNFEARQGVFTRAQYDVTDNITIFGSASWNNTHTQNHSTWIYQLGNLTIKADNAFLPQSVKTAAAALGVTQFSMGKFFTDLNTRGNEPRRSVQRFVGGANGKFDAFDTNWKWDAYYQNGFALISDKLPFDSNNARLGQAIDAVVNPATGQIVCRSNLTGGNPNCIPLNFIGYVQPNFFGGEPNLPAESFISEDMLRSQRFLEHAAAFTLNGEPFSIWAGPVSVAAGVEYRMEKVRGTVEAKYSAGGWATGNYQATNGKFDVVEGFTEVVLPLAKDYAFAKDLELALAARATSYSTSGFVTTWKAGLTYAPVDDVRLRLTRSRDIRAPNLDELFSGGTGATGNVLDPFNNNATTASINFQTGNLNLKPEKADTTALGVVVTPSFLPDFTASVDYYNIDIKAAIAAVGTQTTVDLCYAGQQQYCVNLIRGPVSGGAQGFSRIATTYYNLAKRISRGLDFEAGYRMGLDSVVSNWAGDLRIRGLVSYFLKDYAEGGLPGIDPVREDGSINLPRYRYTVSATYSLDPIDVQLTWRGAPSTTKLNSYIVCSTACPVSSPQHQTVNDNYRAGSSYFDLNLTYKFLVGNADSQVYLNVKNLMNRDPNVDNGSIPFGPNVDLNSQDLLGRVFRAGLRFKM